MTPAGESSDEERECPIGDDASRVETLGSSFSRYQSNDGKRRSLGLPSSGVSRRRAGGCQIVLCLACLAQLFGSESVRRGALTQSSDGKADRRRPSQVTGSISSSCLGSFLGSSEQLAAVGCAAFLVWAWRIARYFFQQAKSSPSVSPSRIPQPPRPFHGKKGASDRPEWPCSPLREAEHGIKAKGAL